MQKMCYVMRIFITLIYFIIPRLNNVFNNFILNNFCVFYTCTRCRYYMYICVCVCRYIDIFYSLFVCRASNVLLYLVKLWIIIIYYHVYLIWTNKDYYNNSGLYLLFNILLLQINVSRNAYIFQTLAVLHVMLVSSEMMRCHVWVVIQVTTWICVKVSYMPTVQFYMFISL